MLSDKTVPSSCIDNVGHDLSSGVYVFVKSFNLTIIAGF